MSYTQDLIRENIKRIRRLYGYTQETIATNVLHISLSAYQKLEQGQRKFTLEHLIQISDFLGIELPTLMRAPGNGDNILNQSDKKRKEFLIELLKTFSIGSSPQEKYTLRDISALLTFIKRYGHTVTYSPSRLRNAIIYDGKIHSTITERVEEIEQVYAEGVPTKYAEVNELIEQANILKNHCNYLQQEINNLNDELTLLYQQKAEELTPAIQSLNSDIKEKEFTLKRIAREIEREKNDADNYVEQQSLASQKLQSEIDDKAKELKTLEYKIIEATTYIEELQSTVASMSKIDSSLLPEHIQEVLQECSSLRAKNAALEAEITDTREEIAQVYDNYDSDVSDEVARIYKERLDEDIDRYVSEYYYRLEKEEVDDMVLLLLKYVHGFISVSEKYKTAFKDASKYITRFKELSENFDFERASDEKYVLDYVRKHIEWEKTTSLLADKLSSEEE